MGELLGAVVGFPGVVFTSALAVVVCFWLLVAVGVTRADSFDEDADLDVVGLGGVPVSVAASLFTLGGWVTGVAGSVAMTRAGLTGMAHAAVDLGLLLASAGVGWGVTRVLVRARARRSADTSDPSPHDLVGSVGRVRAGGAGADSGQAEIATRDGAVVVVDVRRDPSGTTAPLASGSSAVLYAYDEPGAFFWAAPAAVTLTPGVRPPRLPHPHEHARERSSAGHDWPCADCA
ncbi:hypothetical protein C9F11_06715 [Streptomyces sp. YIM 121038]|uniref:hypothetical protein n=1 Tax=Streptomyces sp. YIM 121038 TaxID=2136401 RepID=UPI0011106F77|nr:hypothetical protein [Streptomyces sp. YIM 121038]QCX75043.1 hypothetical protein C9F11_06715 [Streptomyces sp. YIM 121038]